MGKVDEMRKRREAQYGAAAAVEPVSSDRPTGKCSVCGKTLALQNGVVGSHQKGLGKFCTGSRKAPVTDL